MADKPKKHPKIIPPRKPVKPKKAKPPRTNPTKPWWKK